MNETINRIQASLDRKRERMPSTVEFVRPDDEMSAEQQANWMVHLLQKTYHHHAITDRQEALKQSIETGSTRCFFAHENGQVLAVAALIAQVDGAWELGRAAASTLQRGIGGVVMLSAAIEHFTVNKSPLVAEVRVSQVFEGIPGGAATQKICLRDIGLQPHALLPLFGHGDPHRQEQFLLSASKLEQSTQPISAPLTNGISDCFSKLISPLGSLRGFKVALEASQSDSSINGWELVQRQPFAILRPSPGSATLESATSAAFAQAACCLVPIEARSDRHVQVKELLNHGFVPSGIDRLTGDNGEPMVQFARLKPGTVLAPLGLVDSLFNEPQAQALRAIDKAIRKGVTS